RVDALRGQGELDVEAGLEQVRGRDARGRQGVVLVARSLGDPVEGLDGALGTGGAGRGRVRPLVAEGSAATGRHAPGAYRLPALHQVHVGEELDEAAALAGGEVVGAGDRRVLVAADDADRYAARQEGQGCPEGRAVQRGGGVAGRSRAGALRGGRPVAAAQAVLDPVAADDRGGVGDAAGAVVEG